MNDRHLKLDILLEFLDAIEGRTNERRHLYDCDACRRRLSRLRVLRIGQRRRRNLPRHPEGMQRRTYSEEDVAAFLDEMLPARAMSVMEHAVLIDEDLFGEVVRLQGILDEAEKVDASYETTFDAESLFGPRNALVGSLVMILTNRGTPLRFIPEVDQGASFRGRRAGIERQRPASAVSRLAAQGTRSTDPLEVETDRLAIFCWLEHEREPPVLTMELINRLSGEPQGGVAISVDIEADVATDSEGVVEIPVDDLADRLVIHDLQPVELQLVMETSEAR